MGYPVPMLMIRSDIRSLVEVNGALLGEGAWDSYVAMPVSGDGEYYVCVSPLTDDKTYKRYPVTRKIEFCDGKLKQPPPKDVLVCMWPGGVYEISICPGKLPVEEAAPFPFTLDQAELGQGAKRRQFTLYFDNGLKLAVEEAGNIIKGFTLGDGSKGYLQIMEQSDCRLLEVHSELQHLERLLILNYELEVLLDISGSRVEVTNGQPAIIERLGTQRGHERRMRYEYLKGEFFALEPETGFFTHQYTRPATNLELAEAFCEAVREDMKEEALSYLTGDLRDSLDFDEIKQFIGSFKCCRPPLSDKSGAVLGLIYPKEKNIEYAKLFSFEYSGLYISDMSEL